MAGAIAENYRRLGGAQKGRARGAPAYSVYVNRKIGRVLAALAHGWGWTPNVVSAVSALHTYTAIVLLMAVPRSWWLGVVVAVLLALGYAWDSADGQVARLRGGGSVAGEWLDHFLDAIKHATLHPAVLIGLWLYSDLRNTWWLVTPLLYGAIVVVTFFGMLLNDLLKGKKGLPSTHARGGGSALRSLVVLPTDYGVLCWVFVLWGWTPAFLAAYGALMAMNGVFIILASVKWFREMTAIDRQAA